MVIIAFQNGGYIRFIYSFSFATTAGSPQQREPITVCPYYLNPLSTFPVKGNRSTRRKPTTFGRALTILFSHEDWVRVHIKMNLTGDRTQNLRGERQMVWPLHQTRSPKQLKQLVKEHGDHLFLLSKTFSIDVRNIFSILEKILLIQNFLFHFVYVFDLCYVVFDFIKKCREPPQRIKSWNMPDQCRVFFLCL